MANPLDMLKEDHRKVEQLFEEFLRDHDPAVGKQICDELEVHSLVEEREIYPLLSQIGGGETLRRQAEAEHLDVKGIVAGIRQIGYDNPEAIQRFQALQANVAEHVREEEADILPKIEATLSAEALTGAGERAEATKRSLVEEMQRRDAAGA